MLGIEFLISGWKLHQTTKAIKAEAVRAETEDKAGEGLRARGGAMEWAEEIRPLRGEIEELKPKVW